MNDILLLGNITTDKPSAKLKPKPKPSDKLNSKPNLPVKFTGNGRSKIGNVVHERLSPGIRTTQPSYNFQPKVSSIQSNRNKVFPAQLAHTTLPIPPPPPPPNQSSSKLNIAPKPRFSTNFETQRSSHWQDSPKIDKRPKPSLSTFKTSKLFDDGSLNEIEEIESLDVSTNREDLFSVSNFADLKCDRLLVACLQQRFGLVTATKVQSLSIPALISGKDALIKSATGSGKTLAYSIPLVHQLQALVPKLGRAHGLRALVIVPTRELALQTYDCINQLLNPFRRIVLGLLVGGEKKKSEKARIRKGLNILVVTPGRLLDHLGHTNNLRLEALQMLVIDEADRLYEQGFSAVIGQIMEHIQGALHKAEKPLQTVLLSATLSKGVKELAGLSLKNPEIVDVGDESEQKMDRIVLPDSLENCYMIVPPKLRLVMLSCLLLKAFNAGSTKVIVFMSCQDVVDYFSVLLSLVLNKLFREEDAEDEDEVNGEVAGRLTILQLHGNMNQSDRMSAFKKFHDAVHGILLCTDVVSRGLDLPNVDLVVQMSVPPLIEDYVHRVGRTARVGSKGRSILVLLPSETKFVHHLQGQIPIRMDAIKVEQYLDTLNQMALFQNNHQLHTEQERWAYLQHLFEEALADEEKLQAMAAKAYLSHLRAYASYPHKMSYCLPFKELHLGHLAKSFALRQSPSELGANFAKGRGRMMRANKIKDTTSLKRRNVALEDRCSEFGGGIITGKMKKAKKG